ncbi:uncharacterized protein LOC144650748 [Oculina patagonica]
MRAVCGIRSTIGVMAVMFCNWFITSAAYFTLRLLPFTESIEDLMDVIYPALAIALSYVLGACVWCLVIFFRFRKRTKCLSFCFPVACGHRKCVFTGRSSKHLREILLSVDENIPTEEQVQELTYGFLHYADDVKSALEKTTGIYFQYFFSGSVVERFGIPRMLSKKTEWSRPSCSASALDTDLDIMFFTMDEKASLSGEENIVVEPLITESEGFTGYAQLTSLTPGFFVQNGWFVSSKLARSTARNAVQDTPVNNLPGVPWCCGLCKDTLVGVVLNSNGPAINLRAGYQFEADITTCIQCSDWPSISDWSSRPRYWPSVDEAQRIMSLGCHLVAKPAPSDKEEISWRFSFSLAETELSKLVPNTARKCFLALKIIFRDHLQPVMSEITSYHMKTIFLNTLEKVPVGFWIEENVEECLLTLLAELRDALLSKNCPHHWFSYINLFQSRVSCFGMEAKRFQLLAEKVQMILNDPAPFIFDDGCCCISPCCFRAPHCNFTPRTSEQFLAEYDEGMPSADGHVIAGTHYPVDPVNNRHQLSASPSPRSEVQLHLNLYSSRNNGQEITPEPE